MAGKNQVLLTFAGDATKLDKTMAGVGGSADRMSKKVGESGDRFDRVGQSADTLDTRAMGMRDTFTGVQDTFQAFNKEGATMQERALLLGMGIGDLGSGIFNFGIQFARQVAGFVTGGAQMVASMATTVGSTVAGWVTMGFQATVNAAKMAAAWLISLGPIALVILAIGAVIGILVALGVGFDDVKKFASGVFGWIKDNWPLLLAILTGPFGLAVLAISKNWDKIKAGATAVKDWIAGRVEDIVGFFTGMPGRITDAFGALGSGVAEAFKSAWNNSLGGLVVFPGFNPPGPGSLPRITIPTLHQGGIMPGAPGSEGLALLQAGERVTRAGASQAPQVNIYVAGSIHSERDLVKVVRDELTRGGLGGAF